MSDTLKALAFDQAKAKLNLSEAHLQAGTDGYCDFGLYDWDQAAGRILPWEDIRQLIRISA